ncbi:MAG: enoyl-CoA hydratase/isomerase family protein [Gammaproteobacteria bacterium]
MPDALLEKRPDGVAVVTMNRPERMNAASPAMSALLMEYFADCAADPQVRCVALTGAGRGFCAGADIKRLDEAQAAQAGGAAAPEGFFERVEGLRRRQDGITLKLHTMPKPTVAIVNGFAIGAGFSFALGCDIRLAGDEARLSAGFRNLAASGDMGGTYFLSKLVGDGIARELIFTGEMMSAERARALGIVNRVYPQADLMQEALAFCAELARGPTRAFALAKENLAMASVASAKEALDFEAANMILSLTTDDHREAVRAFVEKRAARFKGR